MAFKFNFSVDAVDFSENNTTESEYELPPVPEKKSVKYEPCKEIIPKIKKDERHISSVTYSYNDIHVTCYDSAAIENSLTEQENQESNIQKAVSSDSDLIPDVYEGGLTVWECACDLAEFITGGNVIFKGKSVIELGCGAGIPGICAVKMGASAVHFQDYNVEVVESFTVPNVLELNTPTECDCRFFSGDWGDFQTAAQDDKTLRYDLILTAETIYNTENYSKLHSLFQQLLKDKGEIYIAAKSNYFGVGGGTKLFEDFVNKIGYFSFETVKFIQAGVPREIMKLQQKDKNT